MSPEGGSGRIWVLRCTSWALLRGARPVAQLRQGSDVEQLADPSVGQYFSNMLRAPMGVLLGGDRGIFRSADGLLWSLVNSGTQYVKGGITSDGTTLYASSFGVCNEWGHQPSAVRAIPSG